MTDGQNNYNSLSLIDTEAEDGAWEEWEARFFWRILWGCVAVLAAILVGVAWLLLAIHGGSTN